MLWLLSPAVLATALTLLGIGSTFFPPRIYSEIIGEKNYMFCNLQVLVYIILCWFAYFAGSLIPFLVKNGTCLKIYAKNIHLRSKRSQLIPIVILLLLVITFLSYYIGYTLSTLGIDYLLCTLLAGQGSSLRIELFDLTSEMRLGWVLNFSAALMLWPYYIILQSNSGIRKSLQRTIKILFFFAAVLFVLACLLTLTRGSLFQFLLMIGLIYVFSSIQKGDFTYNRLIRFLFFLLIVLMVLFLAIDNIRSSTIGSEFECHQFLKSGVGYFPASYNRMAAVMSGVLEYPASGIGFYSFRWLFEFPFLARALDFYDLGQHYISSDFPTSNRDLFLDHFAAVGNAGLNPSLTWKTSFGAAYTDFGWFGWLWFFFYGMFSGFLFKSFVQRKLFGIVVYPLIVVGIFHWWSGYVATRDIDIQIVAALFVYGLIITVRTLFLNPYHEKSKIGSR